MGADLLSSDDLQAVTRPSPPPRPSTTPPVSSFTRSFSSPTTRGGSLIRSTTLRPAT